MAEFSDLEDALDATLETDRPVEEFAKGDRRVKYLTGKNLLDTLMAKAFARGMSSSKRGLSVGRIERPS